MLVWKEGPLRSPHARYFLYSCRCVSGIGEERVGGTGPHKATLRTLNGYQGNLSHVAAENAWLKAWPPDKTSRGK